MLIFLIILYKAGKSGNIVVDVSLLFSSSYL